MTSSGRTLRQANPEEKDDDDDEDEDEDEDEKGAESDDR